MTKSTTLDQEPWNRQFLFVTGKGGVGKTTLCAALATHLASQGKRVLVALCGRQTPLVNLFDTDLPDGRMRCIAPNIDAVCMRPHYAIEEYGRMILKVKVLYRALFENPKVMAFLRGTPGLEAWSLLGKAYYHADQDTDDKGNARYDTVIFDAPATGHAIDMLKVPQVICDLAPAGLLRREAEGALTMLRDPARSGALLVTLAEDLPTQECLELYQVFNEELHIPIGAVMLNRFDDAPLDPNLKQQLESPPENLSPWQPAFEWKRHQQQTRLHNLNRLRQNIEAPLLCINEQRPVTLETLRGALEASVI